MTYYRNEDDHDEVFLVSENGTIRKRIVDTREIDGELRTVFKYYKGGHSKYHTLNSLDKLEEVDSSEVGHHGQPVNQV